MMGAAWWWSHLGGAVEEVCLHLSFDQLPHYVIFMVNISAHILSSQSVDFVVYVLSLYLLNY